jgi:hypothetical protein
MGAPPIYVPLIHITSPEKNMQTGKEMEPVKERETGKSFRDAESQ